MKRLYVGVMVVGIAAFVGCNTSPTGGGSTGGTTAGRTGGVGKPTDTFRLKGPETLTAHTVKHGATETFTVTVDKGKEYKEDIHFSATVDPADKDVKAAVEPSDWKSSGPNDVKVKVTVGEKAAAGNYKVTVQAKPAVGAPTEVHWDVKVPAK